MEIQDRGKFLLLGIALIGGFVAGLLGHGEGWVTVAAVVGYLTGNGVLARKGSSPVPVIGPKQQDDA